MKKACLPIAIILVIRLGAIAQDRETELDQQIRDVTPAGPYPVYLRLMPVLEFQNSDFANGIHYFNELKGTSLRETKMGFGFKFDVGVKFAKKLFFELGYQRVQGNASNNDYLVSVANRFYAARIGFAKTFYYPISIQVYTGFLLGGSEFTVDTGNNLTTTSFHGKNWTQDRKGAEAGFRLVFVDPAGSGGGLGYFVETSFVKFFDQYSYSPFLTHLDPSASSAFVSDSKFWTLSVGIVIPIAVKF